MPKEKHPVNVLFTKAEYASLIWRATELTLKEERRVSVAELVRRLVLSKGDLREAETEGAGLGLTPDRDIART